jgi:AcrR family transcriptional regulator
MESETAARPDKSQQLRSNGRTALLDAACHSIAQKGLRGLRIEEVAADAGVAPSLIYHHFGDRASLLRAALEHVGQKAFVYTTTDPDESGYEELVNTFLAEIQDNRTVRENSAAWGEFRDAAVFDETLRQTLFRYTAEWIEDVADLIREGQTDGSIDSGIEPLEGAQHLTALTAGLSTRWLAGFLDTNQARSLLKLGIKRYLGD